MCGYDFQVNYEVVVPFSIIIIAGEKLVCEGERGIRR
jgi:hypothetical protein